MNIVRLWDIISFDESYLLCIFLKEVIKLNDVKLFHGSRGGIIGPIEPKSRLHCDFGKGFYTGTQAMQVKSLIAEDPEPYLYTLNFKLSEIPENKILILNDMQWVYFILYNRDKLNGLEHTSLYKQCKNLKESHDVIIGPVADDVMNHTTSDFLNNNISDIAFLETIKALNYGSQYVAISKEACSHIEIISEKELDGEELDQVFMYAENRRKEGKELANKIKIEYYGKGRLLNQVLEDINKENLKENFIDR